MFVPGELVEIEKDVSPLVVDTATTTGDGLYSVDLLEHAVLEGVVRDLEARNGTENPNSRRADTGDSDVESGGNAAAGGGAYDECRDVESQDAVTLDTPVWQSVPRHNEFGRARMGQR